MAVPAPLFINRRGRSRRCQREERNGSHGTRVLQKCRTGRPQYRVTSLVMNSEIRMANEIASARRGGGGAAGRGRGGQELMGKVGSVRSLHTIPEHIEYLGFEQRYVDRCCSVRVRAL